MDSTAPPTELDTLRAKNAALRLSLLATSEAAATHCKDKLALRAENAAKDATIAELREKLAKAVAELEAWVGTAHATLTERPTVAAMTKALEWYADPEIYKPHPHGPAFDNRDLSFCARAALASSKERTEHG